MIDSYATNVLVSWRVNQLMYTEWGHRMTTTTTQDATTLVDQLKELHATLTPTQQTLLTYILETATTTGTTGTTDEVTGYTATDTTWTGLTTWLTTTTTTTTTTT